jgi:hypothetical protein
MGVVAALGAAAAAVTIGSTIANDTSGGGSAPNGTGYQSGSSPPEAYVPTAQPQEDQNYQNLVQSMYQGAQNLPGQVVPGLDTATQNLTNNPYTAMAQGGANAAGAYGTNTLAPQMQAGASSLFGLGATGAPYGSQILQTGFDPQKALYNQQFNQQQQQSNAINSMYGLGSSPAGAGLAAQNATNFNIDWQQSQLQREATAAQGYGNLVNATGAANAGGADLGTAANGMLVQAGAQPYGAYSTIQGNNASALNTLSTDTQNAYGLDANTLNALAAYLKLGQSATSVGQAGAAQNAANNTALGSALGSGLSGLSNLFGKSNSSTTNSYGAANTANYATTQSPTYQEGGGNPGDFSGYGY